MSNQLTPENEDIVMPEIDIIPDFDEDFTTISPLTVLAETGTVLPERWAITSPEDPNADVLLNFYTGKTVIATFPLTQENLQAIMPALTKLYVDPNKNKTPFIKKTLGWAKKHKFSAVILTFILGCIIYSLGYTLLVSGLGLGLG